VRYAVASRTQVDAPQTHPKNTPMPLYAHLDPASFAFDGGDVGALLLHGLTGAPTEMRGVGEHLRGLGYTVRAPLLPGHGTHHHDLDRTTRHEWTNAAALHLRKMRSELRQVFIVGQSLGALVALHLAATAAMGDGSGDNSVGVVGGVGVGGVGGVVALAPALMVSRAAWFTHLAPLVGLRFFPKNEERNVDLKDKAQLREVWSYSHTPLRAVREILALQREVRPLLGGVRLPLLVMQGRHDRTVRSASAHAVVDGVGSVDKELVWLEGSGHIVSVDADRADVCARIARFIAARHR